MTTGMLYSDWISAVATLLEYDNTITSAASPSPSTSAAFNTMYPRAIEYGEQRMYRELDLLSTRVSDFGALAANDRQFTLPTNSPSAGSIYVVLEQISLVIGGNTLPPLLPVSREALCFLYPSDNAPTTPSLPTMWAPNDQTSILVAPAPDQIYSVATFGTKRPAALSATNTQTFLSEYLPDAFLAATMIFWSGFQRDFGAQSDDPKMAQSWETQYMTLVKSANVEELRKKFQANGWTSRLPSPIATPPQT